MLQCVHVNNNDYTHKVSQFRQLAISLVGRM